jgi:hypothetical protein
MVIDRKKQQDEWFSLYELNDDQLERLIENKFIRATQYHKSYKVREQKAEELE